MVVEQERRIDIEYKHYIASLKGVYNKTINMLHKVNPTNDASMIKLMYHVACLTHMLLGIRLLVNTLMIRDIDRRTMTLEINSYRVPVPQFYVDVVDQYIKYLRERQPNLNSHSLLFPVFKRRVFLTKLPEIAGIDVTKSTKIIAKLYILKTGDVRATFKMMGLRNALFNSIILKELEEDGYKYDRGSDTLFFDGKPLEKRGFYEPLIVSLPP